MFSYSTDRSFNTASSICISAFYLCISGFIMAKVQKVGQLKPSNKKQHASSYEVSPCSHKIAKATHKRKRCTASAKKDWEDARCSICMESPHNAVLLLCSSYNKGCRPYMCSTSSRFSNCLDQYKKAYTKLTSLFSPQPATEILDSEGPQEKEEVPQLCCPICRGQVKGWAVVEHARRDLNKKKRSCMQENCSFVGNYKQLKKHVKTEHPLSRPRDVDPALEEKWKTLEREREHNDVISAITSSDPGAIVLGDFVIEGGQSPFYRNFGGNLDGFLDENNFVIHPFSSSRLGFASDRRFARFQSVYGGEDSGARHRAPAVDLNGGALPASRHHRRLLFGRKSRRARRSRTS